MSRRNPLVVWNKETPLEEGWYWCKYKGKNGWTKCPCYLTMFKSPGMCGNVVRTARNDSLMEGPNHGGWGLKWADGKPATDFSFGPKIEEV